MKLDDIDPADGDVEGVAGESRQCLGGVPMYDTLNLLRPVRVQRCWRRCERKTRSADGMCSAHAGTQTYEDLTAYWRRGRQS